MTDDKKDRCGHLAECEAKDAKESRMRLSLSSNCKHIESFPVSYTHLTLPTTPYV